jgi:hypothetical protein
MQDATELTGPTRRQSAYRPAPDALPWRENSNVPKLDLCRAVSGVHGGPCLPMVYVDSVLAAFGLVSSQPDSTSAISTQWPTSSASAGRSPSPTYASSMTLVSDRGRIARHIIPLLGRRSVASVTRNDIDGFMRDVAMGKTTSRQQKTKPSGLSVARDGVASAVLGCSVQCCSQGPAVRQPGTCHSHRTAWPLV